MSFAAASANGIPAAPPTPTGLASLPPKPPMSLNNPRASLGPNERLRQPLSPRVAVSSPSARPTSELLANVTIAQPTPEAEALDQWFENLQNYEVTLEEMAAASLDQNFKEELTAIEEWFRVLSEAERTAALYSLLQSATQVQIRFFIQVLQQMSRADPMTAVLSPSMGGSMQNQMEQKLNQLGLKSPGLKAPSSPAVRNFSAGSANRASFGGDISSFLSPDSAALSDAAGTLAQKRAQLKATQAAHRISAPGLINSNNNVWTGSSLSQVMERQASPSPEPPVSPGLAPATATIRPKSTDFAGVANTLRSPRPNLTEDPPNDGLSPMIGGHWSSMVNTPLVPMFSADNQQNNTNGLDAVNAKLNQWGGAGNDASARVPLMDDAKKFRRKSPAIDEAMSGLRPANGNAALLAQQLAANRSVGADGVNNFNGLGGLSPHMNGLGMGGFGGLAGLQAMGAGGLSPLTANMTGMNLNGLAGMNQMDLLSLNLSPIGLGAGLNLNAAAQAQLLAQLATGGYPNSASSIKFAGLQTPLTAGRPRSAGRRSPSGKVGFNGPASARTDDDIDPNVLQDVPGWLRSLRLHKYTTNFEGMDWKDMVMMDEAALEKKGVAALGARRKMLKTFEAVRIKMGIEGPPPMSAVSTNATSISGGEEPTSAIE
ncbi:hypothetical protein DACRYDRAFT_21330 [Dacryopinax primogenitus]|uniref:RNA-binding protein VTS1 n=1 Tax=Dacryopinax primogenitus (strain DJM 731) TaxID=1858805 RepID=M5GAG2_DACPD|nr:uncharacterized protein DACRYDRAFT_21330 [Dacryopinax primogenitus]EJU02937.1 hypothetical protein DACRYDRAFT_21330 [Dacryopinax primogenitus]